MKVAVTGSNGFVGSHVSACLANQSDIEVTLCYRSNSERKNTAKVSYVKFDMADADQHTYENLGSPDVLIHLAWGGLPNYSSDFHIENELPVQINFLTHLIESGLKRLVITGTCYEYGMQSGELSEAAEITPVTKYGQAKALLLAVLEQLKTAHEFELVWLRLFYLYGTGQANSSLYSQFQHAIDTQQTVFNMSGGEQTRDFLPVKSAAERIVAISLLTDTSGIFNLCSGVPISVRDLVSQWIAECNSSIRMNLGYFPYSKFEPMEFWGNPMKLNEVIGRK